MENKKEPLDNIKDTEEKLFEEDNNPILETKPETKTKSVDDLFNGDDDKQETQSILNDREDIKKQKLEARKQKKAKNEVHNFYTDKKGKKPAKTKIGKAWRKKWVKATTVGVLIVAIGLGVGLGVGLGIDWGTDSDLSLNTPNGSENLNDNCDLTPGVSGGSGFCGYIQTNTNQSNAAYQNTLNILSNDAIIYTFNQLGDMGVLNIPNPQKVYDNAQTAAKNQVTTNENNYKSEYGSSWQTQWNDYLQGMGYSNNAEYENSIIASNLLDDVIAPYTTFNISTGSNSIPTTLITINSNDASNYQYHASEYLAQPYVGQSGNYLYAINNWSNVTNLSNYKYAITPQQMVTAYLNFYEPIAYTDLTIPFTYASTANNGVQPSPITFSSVTPLEQWYNVDSAILQAGGDGTNGPNYATNSTSTAFNFQNEITYTSSTGTSGVQSFTGLSTASQQLTDSILFSVLGYTSGANTSIQPMTWSNDTSFNPPTSQPTPTLGVTQSINVNNFLYSVSDAIGSYITKQGPSSNPLTWPGYSDGSGSNQYMSSTTGNSNYTSWTTVGTYLSNIGINLNSNFVEYGVTPDYSRAIVNLLPIYSTGYWVANPNQITAPTISDSEQTYLSTIGPAGWHLTMIDQLNPGEYANGYLTESNAPVTGISVLGYRMITSDLNKALAPPSDSYYANDVQSYGMATNYTNWVTNNATNIILNQQLNNPEFLYQEGQSGVLPSNVATQTSTNGGNATYTVNESVLQPYVNVFYNGIYQSLYSKSLSLYSSVYNLIEPNSTNTIYSFYNIGGSQTNFFTTLWNLIEINTLPVVYGNSAVGASDPYPTNWTVTTLQNANSSITTNRTKYFGDYSAGTIG